MHVPLSRLLLERKSPTAGDTVGQQLERALAMEAYGWAEVAQDGASEWPSRRVGHSSCVHKGSMYVFGGGDEYFLGDFRCFDFGE